MQIGAINSVNFKGMNGIESRESGVYQDPKAQGRGAVDADFVVLQGNTDKTSDMPKSEAGISVDDILEKMANFKKDVKEAKQDVHPLTCLLGVLAGVCAIVKGNKAVGWARSAVAVSGGAVAKGAVKVASKVAKSIDADKAVAKINGVVGKLSEKTNVNNDKLVTPFVDTVDKIFSRTVDGVTEKKGQAVVEKINNLGIYFNPGSLFDGLVAGALAYKAADVVSDGSESGLDRMAINTSARRNLGEIAEIINTVAS